MARHGTARATARRSGVLLEAHVPDAAADLPLTLRPRTGRGQRAFRIALLLLPIGVLGNVAYTWLATDRELLQSVHALPRTYLLAALAFTLTPWLTGSLRLLVWSRFLGHRVPLVELLRMTLVVDLGAAVSPTAIGGEAFRWGMLVRHGVRAGHAATLALMPKLEDAVFFLIAVPAAIVWTAAWRLPVVVSSSRILSQNALTVAGIAGLIALIAWLMSRGALRGHAGARLRGTAIRFWGRSRRRLRHARRDATAAFTLILARGKARFALTLTLTAAHWLARYSVITALALFLGMPFDPVLFWLLQWVVFTMMSFVPTPGAAGGAEVAFTAVYATLMPTGFIGVATAAWRVFTFYVPVALAALLFPLLGRFSEAGQSRPPGIPGESLDTAQEGS